MDIEKIQITLSDGRTIIIDNIIGEEFSVTPCYAGQSFLISQEPEVDVSLHLVTRTSDIKFITPDFEKEWETLILQNEK